MRPLQDLRGSRISDVGRNEQLIGEARAKASLPEVIASVGMSCTGAMRCACLFSAGVPLLIKTCNVLTGGERLLS